MERITMVTGHFGSGKSEIAINLAKKWNKSGEKVGIVDLDIVNPFFCVRDFREELEEEGIEVIGANKEWSNAELMMVPKEVKGIFVRPDVRFIMDIGGDDSGAVVLGQYSEDFKHEPYDSYFVINTLRPMTPGEAGIKEYLKDIEKSSRLKITHLISNTNLSYETEIEDIIKGDEVVHELSKELKIPHLYTAVREDLVALVEGKLHGEILPLTIHMKTPWR